MNQNDIIRLEGLKKTFVTKDNTVVALDGIDLSIKKGEVFGVIGLSGAGKSTLVRCINLLERPTEGKVIFNGKDLASMPKKELLKTRMSIGMIFQGFNLLEQRTAFKNICFPLEVAGWSKDDMEKRATELLGIVGLSDKRNSYPSQLSGGQKQRVAIARALAMNPEVLLCDEATSALDPETTQSILDLLKRINREMGVTIVVITHEMRVVEQICHRVAIIDHSHIVEMGEVKDVFLHPKSPIGRQLIIPKNDGASQVMSKRSIRIVFDGNSSYEPIVSHMSLSCNVTVNILFADTRNIDDKAYGQMVLQLPEDQASVGRIFAYLDEKGISYKEEKM